MGIDKFINEICFRFNCSSEQTDKITEYCSFLLFANKKISLTRVRDSKEWVIDHVEDSLRAYEVFKKYKFTYFIDCGSGNGLPGIIFGILSGLDFTLIDTDKRKFEFLKVLIHRLKLNGQVFDKSFVEFLSKCTEKGTTCFIYRGLGPPTLVAEGPVIFSKSSHFRFISSSQNSLFLDSHFDEYKLSNGKERFIEIKST